jgi:hypothetical protein
VGPEQGVAKSNWLYAVSSDMLQEVITRFRGELLFLLQPSTALARRLHSTRLRLYSTCSSFYPCGDHSTPSELAYPAIKKVLEKTGIGAPQASIGTANALLQKGIEQVAPKVIKCFKGQALATVASHKSQAENRCRPSCAWAKAKGLPKKNRRPPWWVGIGRSEAKKGPGSFFLSSRYFVMVFSNPPRRETPKNVIKKNREKKFWIFVDVFVNTFERCFCKKFLWCF